MPDPRLRDRGSAGQIALPHPVVAIPAEETAQVAREISRALKRAATKSRAPVSVISGGGHVTRPGERLFRQGLLASFMLVVVLPMFVAAVYWGLIASRQYVTEAKFALHSSDSPSFAALGVASHDEKQIQDAQVVVRYVLGRSIVEALEKSIDLRGKFSRPEADYFSRFAPDGPIEALEKYWRKRVDASLDLMSGIVSVHIRAFTPEDSLAIAQNVIALSENLVNDLSTRTRHDAVAQAQAELTRAEERLKAATATMRDARNAEGVLDAPSAAEAINKVLTQLRLELSRTESTLALQSNASTQQSPQARLLAAREASLKKQIADYSAQIASAEVKGTLAERASVLSARQVDLKLAEQQYAQTAAAYESARVDLERQRAYLALFLRPTLAEKSIYPRRWLEWSIIAGPALLIWVLLVGLSLLVRDHMAK